MTETAVAFPKPGPYCGTASVGTSVSARGKGLVKLGIRSWATSTAPWRALPNFLIVGAKRGGTTSLYNYLLGHPQVWPMVPEKQRVKGTYYFDVNFYQRSQAWYRSHFAFEATLARNKAITGEATPYYLYHPHAARRAAALVPDVKIIMILRDPVDRAWSHHRERTGQGFEKLSFEEALDAEQVRTAGQVERMKADQKYQSLAHQMWSYVDQGRYLDGLLEWERWFSKHQILVLRSEDLYRDAEEVLDRVHHFLGLDHFRLNHHKVWNLQRRSPLEPAVRKRLSEELAADVDALEQHLGRSMEWNNFS